ncbi:MAG: sugar ABC transporter substrate-binding protein [Anaerolineae bacterium]|nr:sugar ABC transporter substrate-binding protein [Anaerolineae bacterium]
MPCQNLPAGANKYPGQNRMVWLWVGLLLMLGLPGCGLAAPTPKPEPVTLVFAHPDYDTEYYKPLVEAFNQSHPHITVELNPWPEEGLDFLLDEADVLAVNSFALSELREQNTVLNLDPLIEQDQSLDLPDFYPGTVEMLKNEGKTWAIPAGVDVDVMYYNKDLFDQNNVPYPHIDWTWDDFLNSGLSVTNPEAGIYGYTTTGPVTTPGFFDAVYFIYQHGGRIVDDVQNPSQTTFDEPLTIEAVEWYAKLYTEYDIAPTLQEARRTFRGGQYAIYDGIRNGRIGMWIGALSERGGLTWPVEWDMNWGVAPLPRDAQSLTQIWVEGYAIAAQTQDVEAAWQWILFLSRQTSYRLVPARPSLAESEAYQKKVGGEVATAALASIKNAVLVPPATGAKLAGAMQIFGRAVDEAVNDRATAQEAMVVAQREAETMMGSVPVE